MEEQSGGDKMSGNISPLQLTFGHRWQKGPPPHPPPCHRLMSKSKSCAQVKVPQKKSLYGLVTAHFKPASASSSLRARPYIVYSWHFHSEPLVRQKEGV